MKRVGVGVLCFVAACGDGAAVDPGADAPRPLDAPALDAPGPCWADFDPVDHGEVRVELVHHADGTTAARATAFVYADLGAPRHQFIDLDGCTDVSGHDRWPFDTYRAATYHDPGQVLISGGAQPLQLTRQTSAGVDAMGRPHPANAWFAHDGGSGADDGAQYLSADARFTPTFAGSANLPGAVYTDALYIPPTFDLTTPGMEPVAVSTATALTFTTTNPTAEHKVPGYNIVSSVVFSGPDGPAVVCTKTADGSLTVPPAIVDLVRATYATGGTLIRETSLTVPQALDDGTEHADANGCPLTLAVFVTGSNRYESTFTVEP